ncbi:MAG: hypothetical protein IIC59_02480 [Proteobacteria bacterium]|nr:hypothetical protein [Pseudomonadota bacterium]MCH8174030.1 hypothetical protein [Pseudomonadota bacterium]
MPTKYWAECFGTAPYLPMSREEMDTLGWDSCDIIIVTADAPQFWHGGGWPRTRSAGLFWFALRPGAKRSRIYRRTGDSPCWRLPENRTGAQRA